MKSQKYSDQDSTSTPATGSSASYESTDSVFIWDNHFANQFEQFSYDSINENDERPKEHVPNLWDPQSAIICEDFLEQLSPCSLRVTKLKLQYSTPDIVKSVDLSETCLKKSVEKVDSDTESESEYTDKIVQEVELFVGVSPYNIPLKENKYQSHQRLNIGNNAASKHII
ncbi:hypothetical protein QYM36_014646 [Artemia franciscana]|uniref:Uncharacterized protein n=1 Tax=Artemia franciscana TaxID=6661 RepID=A0AA88KWL9_ARTSF|nr:hypothetical protein QYM36_014646 [Artemia franciscana]